MNARSNAAPPGFMTCTAFLPLCACAVSTESVPPACVLVFHMPPGLPDAAYDSKSSQKSAPPHAPVVGVASAAGATSPPPASVTPPAPVASASALPAAPPLAPAAPVVVAIPPAPPAPAAE